MKIDFEIYFEMRKISNNDGIYSNLHKDLVIRFSYDYLQLFEYQIRPQFNAYMCILFEVILIHIRAFTCSNASKSRNVIKVEAYSH